MSLSISWAGANPDASEGEAIVSEANALGNSKDMQTEHDDDF